MNLNARLTKIRAVLNADFYGEHRRRKEDVVPPLPERTPEFSARVERALNIGNVNGGHDAPFNAGAVAALDAAIQPTISWRRRYRRRIAKYYLKLANYLLDLAHRWLR